jgi:hypothetical protein
VSKNTDPPEGYVSSQFGVLQERLQFGPLWRLGNAVSTARWYVWRLRGGKYWGKVTAKLYACEGCADLPALDKERG